MAKESFDRSKPHTEQVIGDFVDGVVNAFEQGVHTAGMWIEQASGWITNLF